MEEQEEKKHKKVFIFNRNTPNTVANIGRALPAHPPSPAGIPGTPGVPAVTGTPAIPGAPAAQGSPAVQGIPASSSPGLPSAPAAPPRAPSGGALQESRVPQSSLPPAAVQSATGMATTNIPAPPLVQKAPQSPSLSPLESLSSKENAPGTESAGNEEAAAGIEGLKTSPITVTPQGITKGAAPASDLPDNAAAMGAGAPKVLISALREKVSYMLAFQMKINNLSKQLKGLMNRPANKAPASPPPPDKN